MRVHGKSELFKIKTCFSPGHLTELLINYRVTEVLLYQLRKLRDKTSTTGLRILESKNFIASPTEARELPSSCLLMKKFKGIFSVGFSILQ